MNSEEARRSPRFVYLTDRPEGSVPARFGWRLTAANFRPLGYGAAIVRSLDACLADAVQVRNRAHEVPATVQTYRGLWRWEVVAGRPLARSARLYARRIECERAYGHFLDALTTAEPGAGVVRHVGPHALAGFGDTGQRR